MFGAAYGWLLLGNHRITPSADPGAGTISVWAALVPAVAAIALARLVGPRSDQPVPLEQLPRDRIARETWILLALAVAFPIAAYGTAHGLWYPPLKVLLLLVVPLVVFRLSRGTGPVARAIPKPVVWLAPLPAVGVWFVLTEVWPFARPLTQDLPDPVTLAIGSLLTALTAGVLEEVFYRGWLQTRLEALYGRWPAILATSLLFAVMHLDRVRPEAIGIGLASIVAYQGMFGLMQGYLWSRYRNIWIVIGVHLVINLVYVDLLFGALRS